MLIALVKNQVSFPIAMALIKLETKNLYYLKSQKTQKHFCAPVVIAKTNPIVMAHINLETL